MLDVRVQHQEQWSLGRDPGDRKREHAVDTHVSDCSHSPAKALLTGHAEVDVSTARGWANWLPSCDLLSHARVHWTTHHDHHRCLADSEVLLARPRGASAPILKAALGSLITSYPFGDYCLPQWRYRPTARG
jgi:hypothetical protein